MNKDKRNNIQLLGTLNNTDESGIIANANQVYDANEDKSTQDVSKEHKKRIETLETKESSMQTTLENITKTGEASAASNVTYNHNDSKLDATNVQQAIDEVRKKSNYNDGENIIDFNTIHLITDNPEYICVAVDADDKILYGIKTDGQLYFGVGCPQQVKDYIDEQINKILGTDDITATIDSLKEIETFLKDFTNSDTLKKLLDLKANVDEVKATTNNIYKKSNPNDEEGNVVDTNTISSIGNNPEYIQAITDSVGKLIEAIGLDGARKFFAGIDIQGTLQCVISNGEYASVFLSKDKKIIKATKKDGTELFSKGIEIGKEGFNLYIKDNPEYSIIVIDNEGRIIRGLKVDGTTVGLNIANTEKIDADIKALTIAIKQISEVNDNYIILPLHLYFFSDYSVEMYKKAIIQKATDRYRIICHSNSIRQYGDKLILKPSDATTLNFSLYDLQKENCFEAVSNKNAIVRSGVSKTGDNNLYIQIVGDSWVHWFYPYKGIKELVPNVHFIGTQNDYKSEYSGERMEGRSGWTLANYFSHITKLNGTSPFYHPKGKYMYWGTLDYQVEVYNSISKGDSRSDDDKKQYGSSDDIFNTYFEFDRSVSKVKFKSPKKGYVIYDTSNYWGKGSNVYLYYNGTDWEVNNDIANVEWEFNYSKYLSMFSELIGSNLPTYLFVALGINDYSPYSFSDTELPNLEDKFKKITYSNMEKLIASYKEAVPNGKIIIVTPPDLYGIEDNMSSLPSTSLINRKFFKVRELYIKYYDNREDENIYLLDQSIMIDEIYGYPSIEENPMSGYDGTEKRFVQQSYSPHAETSYYNCGKAYAAFLQYFRNK